MSIQSVIPTSGAGAASAAGLSTGCQRVADATAAAGGYLSEFAQLCAVWNGKLDANGDLQGKDGVALTSHDDDPAPMPDALAAVDALRNQAQTLAGAAPSTATDWLADLGWPAAGQERVRSSGMADGVAEVSLVVPSTLPAGTDPDHMGFVKFAEVPGGAVLFRDVTITVNGKVVVDNTGEGDTAPSFSYTLGNPDGYRAAGAAFNLNPGDVVAITVRNGANTTTQPGDFLLDFATPGRY